MSFPTARGNAIKDYFHNKSYLTYDYESILKQSNNILAIEYLKALKRLNSNILPATISRQGSRYKDIILEKNFASATAIRKSILESGVHSVKKSVPEPTLNYYNHFFKSSINLIV